MIEIPTATVIPSSKTYSKEDLRKKRQQGLMAASAVALAFLIAGGLIGYLISHHHEEGIIKADNAAITQLTNEGYQLNARYLDQKQRYDSNQQFLATHYVDSHGNWREKKAAKK